METLYTVYWNSPLQGASGGYIALTLAEVWEKLALHIGPDTEVTVTTHAVQALQP